MTKIIKERQRFRRRAVTDDEARAELAYEPYKLELIADKSKAGDSDDDGAECRGRRRRADHLRQPPAGRFRCLEGSLPRSARAAHRLHPGVRAHPQLRGVLAR